MDRLKVLIVDDEDSIVHLLAGIIKKEGYHVWTATDGQDAINKLKVNSVDLVITDLKMPKVDGLSLLQHVRQRFPETMVVLLTAHGTIDIAVKAMKTGAWDFLIKPLESPEQLRRLVTRAGEQQRFNYGVKPGKDNQIRDQLIYADSKMEEVIQMVELVAPTDSTVLISGESGTGKEMIAREIHRLSYRKDKPFIGINCAVLPENLLESELFGYEKGAFTGAQERKPGLFEIAHGGTIFLDEIGEVNPIIQVKLLRVLQERSFNRIGGTAMVTVDVRVIAATNRDLIKAVTENLFRDDLYYRLNVFPIHLPPLRQRLNDVLLIAEYYINKYNEKMSKRNKGLSEDARRVLLNYSWPGNARELSNTLERAMILCPDGQYIGPEHLGLVSMAINSQEHMAKLKEIEQIAIEKALEECDGNRKKAAERLGISLRSLYYKIKEYDIRF